MERIKIETRVPKSIPVEYEGISFEVADFVTFAQKVFLVNKYLEDYFAPENNLTEMASYDFVGAELSFRNYVYQLCTNIEVTSLENDFFVDDDIWDLVSQRISNFWNIREAIEQSVDLVKFKAKLDASVGEVMKAFVEKGYDVLKSLSDLDPAVIEKAGETGKELIKELDEVSILKTPAKKRGRKKAS